MAWNDNEKAWAREMMRDYFYMGEHTEMIDVDTVLFAGTESERKAVVRAYARDVIKARRIGRKSILTNEVDAIDAEVAVMPTDE